MKGWFLEPLLSVGAFDGESPDRRGRRRVMVGALWFSLIPIALSSLNAVGPEDALAEFGKVAVHIAALAILAFRPLAFAWVFRFVFAGDVAADLALTVLFGGLYASGLQIAWSLIVVLGALIAFSIREAALWFGVFVVAVIFAGTVAVVDDPRYMLPDDPQSDAVFTLVGVTVLVFLVMTYFVRQRERYRTESDDLLHNILPDTIAARLKTDPGTVADHFDRASVLFADVVGFTPMSADMEPSELVHLLDEVFSDIDHLVAELGLEKIKTIGDEYMVAAGVPEPHADHAVAICELGIRIQEHASSHTYRGQRLEFRIGINSGPVVAGVIGDRRFAYDLWGDVVNTASRMESSGRPGQIQITRSTKVLVQDDFLCVPAGTTDVKGKGQMNTWYIERFQPHHDADRAQR